MSNIQQVGDKVLANVERVIVGKHQEVRLALVALLCRGPPPDRGRPRHRQDHARQGDRPQPRLHLPAHPVHARPPADRRDRPLDLQPEDPGVRVPAGPDHEPGRAGRRDQPGHAQDPVRAPRVHGGAPGDDRRRHAPRCPTRSSSSPRRTRSSTRARSRCRRPSSTGSCSASGSGTRSRSTRSSSSTSRSGRTRSRTSPRSARWTSCARCRPASARSTSTRRVSDYIVRLVVVDADPSRRLPRAQPARLARALPGEPGAGRR